MLTKFVAAVIGVNEQYERHLIDRVLLILLSLASASIKKLSVSIAFVLLHFNERTTVLAY